jgi:hypothetical protein
MDSSLGQWILKVVMGFQSNLHVAMGFWRSTKIWFCTEKGNLIDLVWLGLFLEGNKKPLDLLN